MNILHPHGMTERLDRRGRKPGKPMAYGRQKAGSPQDERTLKIADSNDRRERRRQDDDPLRGRLVDLST